MSRFTVFVFLAVVSLVPAFAFEPFSVTDEKDKTSYSVTESEITIHDASEVLYIAKKLGVSDLDPFKPSTLVFHISDRGESKRSTSLEQSTKDMRVVSASAETTIEFQSADGTMRTYYVGGGGSGFFGDAKLTVESAEVTGVKGMKSYLLFTLSVPRHTSVFSWRMSGEYAAVPIR